MSYRSLLVTLVATLLTVNFAMGQNPAERSANYSSASYSGELDFSNENVEFGAFQQNASESVTLFEAGSQPATAPLVASQSKTQQKIVSNTLTFIGAALLISIIVVGTFVFSTRRDQFGERKHANSDW